MPGAERVPQGSQVLTSDDVFDDLLDLRSLNDGIDLARRELLGEYRSLRESGFQLKSLEDYDQLKRVIAAKRKSGSAFVRQEVGVNVAGKSNGETSFRYFTSRITEGRLYLLDEPENSLSAAYQRELAKILEDSARFYRCQFIVATHSPFLLAMEGAVVYNLDESPIAPAPGRNCRRCGCGTPSSGPTGRSWRPTEKEKGNGRKRLSHRKLCALWGAAGGAAGLWQPAGLPADLWGGFPVHPGKNPVHEDPKKRIRAYLVVAYAGMLAAQVALCEQVLFVEKGTFTSSPSGGCLGCC